MKLLLKIIGSFLIFIATFLESIGFYRQAILLARIVTPLPYPFAHFYYGRLLLDPMTGFSDANEGLKWLRKAASENYQPAIEKYESCKDIDQEILDATKQLVTMNAPKLFQYWDIFRPCLWLTVLGYGLYAVIFG